MFTTTFISFFFSIFFLYLAYGTGTRICVCNVVLKCTVSVHIIISASGHDLMKTKKAQLKLWRIVKPRDKGPRIDTRASVGPCLNGGTLLRGDSNTSHHYSTRPCKVCRIAHTTVHKIVQKFTNKLLVLFTNVTVHILTSIQFCYSYMFLFCH